MAAPAQDDAQTRFQFRPWPAHLLPQEGRVTSRWHPQAALVLQAIVTATGEAARGGRFSTACLQMPQSSNKQAWLNSSPGEKERNINKRKMGVPPAQPTTTAANSPSIMSTTATPMSSTGWSLHAGQGAKGLQGVCHSPLTTPCEDSMIIPVL